MRYSIRTIGPVAPASAIPVAVSLDEAKDHLKIDFDTDDNLILAYIASAQDAVEKFTSQVLTPRIMELSLQAFPLGCAPQRDAAIEIPREPVTSIVSVGYTDATGADVALDESAWRWAESAPSLVRAAWATSWPSAALEDGSVRVQFEAGYEDGLCPASLVEAVRRQVAFLNGNRGDVVGGDGDGGLAPGVMALCRPYRKVSI